MEPSPAGTASPSCGAPRLPRQCLPPDTAVPSCGARDFCVASPVEPAIGVVAYIGNIVDTPSSPLDAAAVSLSPRIGAMAVSSPCVMARQPWCSPLASSYTTTALPTSPHFASRCGGGFVVVSRGGGGGFERTIGIVNVSVLAS